MSNSIIESITGSIRVARLTVDQYEQMIAAGILPEGAPVELIDGLLVMKDRAATGESRMTVGPQHQLVLNKLLRLASAVQRHRCFLSVQGPIRIPPSSEPEPDAAIVRGEPEDYAKRHPGPRDVYAVIEVADSSLLADRTAKLRVYAAAGINQYVIVNLIDHQVEIHYSPSPKEGMYKGSAIRTGRESVALAAGLSKAYVKVKAADLLP